MLSDALGRWGNMDPAIRPVAAGMQCFGPAFTLRCWPADNLTIHRAVELAAHGDVLVIDGGSGRDTALLGDILGYAARLRRVAGSGRLNSPACHTLTTAVSSSAPGISSPATTMESWWCLGKRSPPWPTASA